MNPRNQLQSPEHQAFSQFLVLLFCFCFSTAHLVSLLNTSLSVREVSGLIPRPGKLNALFPTLCHLCDVSSELCCLGAQPRRGPATRHTLLCNTAIIMKVCFSCLVHVCGKQRQLVVNDYFVQLQAPAFPGEYSSSLNCEYTFIAPEGTRIRFWIDDFGTERFGSYYYLWVTVLPFINFKIRNTANTKKNFNKNSSNRQKCVRISPNIGLLSTTIK